ncbi:MAG: hypothetical protein ACYCY1_09980 [Sulfuriferula sp.]
MIMKRIVGSPVVVEVGVLPISIDRRQDALTIRRTAGSQIDMPGIFFQYIFMGQVSPSTVSIAAGWESPQTSPVQTAMTCLSTFGGNPVASYLPGASLIIFHPLRHQLRHHC